MTNTHIPPDASFSSLDAFAADRPADALHIMCVLPTLNPYGGVVSVVNALNILIDQGHYVTLVCLSSHKTDLVHPKTEPLYLEDWDSFPADLAAGYDIYLATSWETVPIVATMAQRQPSSATFYYVQDFEPDFYKESEVETRRQALATYTTIPNTFVKTLHLQSKLAEHGFSARRIPPGMNLDIFYPRAGKASERPKRVLAMARPDTQDDHRGYSILVEVYRELAVRDPSIALAWFGTNDLPDHGFPVQSFGRVPPSELPVLYSGAQIFLDTSRFHGFGRTGAEAMACGTACVLSDSGGISEYAVDDHNAIIVPVGDVARTVEAIEGLLADLGRMDTLASHGLETVAGLSDYKATAAIERLFRAELETIRS